MRRQQWVEMPVTLSVCLCCQGGGDARARGPRRGGMLPAARAGRAQHGAAGGADGRRLARAAARHAPQGRRVQRRGRGRGSQPHLGACHRAPVRHGCVRRRRPPICLSVCRLRLLPLCLSAAGRQQLVLGCLAGQSGSSTYRATAGAATAPVPLSLLCPSSPLAARARDPGMDRCALGSWPKHRHADARALDQSRPPPRAAPGPRALEWASRIDRQTQGRGAAGDLLDALPCRAAQAAWRRSWQRRCRPAHPATSRRTTRSSTGPAG
jgi:hypothetical protein